MAFTDMDEWMRGWLPFLILTKSKSLTSQNLWIMVRTHCSLQQGWVNNHGRVFWESKNTALFPVMASNWPLARELGYLQFPQTTAEVLRRLGPEVACREKGLLVFIYNGTGPCTSTSCHSGMGYVRLLKEPWLQAWADTSSTDATVLRNTRETQQWNNDWRTRRQDNSALSEGSIRSWMRSQDILSYFA